MSGDIKRQVHENEAYEHIEAFCDTTSGKVCCGTPDLYKGLDCSTLINMVCSCIYKWMIITMMKHTYVCEMERTNSVVAAH